MQNTEFDYIIVGGGPGGCVLANRLSENPKNKVCLIEAGGPDKSNLIHVPIGIVGMVPTGMANWRFETVPQAGLNGRAGFQPRGKVLGGSSSINAMVYTRGHAYDYDHWAALGNEGWGYQDVLPYFKKCEGNEAFDDAYHGANGPLGVAHLRSMHPAGAAFIEAARGLQLPISDDFNGATQEGVGAYQVMQRGGKRCSAAVAYLKPVLDRSNLTVLTHCAVQKVLLKDKRAVGIHARKKGRDLSLTARGEVILSAGAFGTPQILMLSGIGDAAHLKEHGIEPVHHLPGVGQNLVDHIDYISVYKNSDRSTFGVSLSAAWDMLKEGLKYRHHKQGRWTSNIAEIGGFLRTDPDLPAPDVQLHFAPVMIDDHARKTHFGHGISCHVCVLRPKSVGSVKLASNRADDAPLIDPAFLEDDADMATLRRGIRLMHRILKQPEMARWTSKNLYRDDENLDDAGLDALIRQRADTVYHPVGTAKMGHDNMAVVHPDGLRVHGVEGLRVVDASIMPTIVGGNTTAPVLMIAEKAAEAILKQQRG